MTPLEPIQGATCQQFDHPDLTRVVADRQLATALARSFLSGLPSRLIDELIAVGDRIDVPAGSTIHRQCRRHACSGTLEHCGPVLTRRVKSSVVANLGVLKQILEH